MSLHLVELPLDLAALHAWFATREIGRGSLDEGLALHHLLAEASVPAHFGRFA